MTINSLDEFFDRDEKAYFKRARYPKPYVKTKTYTLANASVNIALKDTGSGYVELCDADGERVGILFIQGTNWQELEAEAKKLIKLSTEEAT